MDEVQALRGQFNERSDWEVGWPVCGSFVVWADDLQVAWPVGWCVQVLVLVVKTDRHIGRMVGTERRMTIRVMHGSIPPRGFFVVRSKLQQHGAGSDGTPLGC